jgi:hypothetical protein
MADVTTEGLEVEELVADGAGHTDHEQHTDEQHTDPALPSAGWPCQQRRKGRTAELPAPQRFLDLPIWMSAPARRPEPEEETV